jgi:hypothetical protein
MLLFDFLVMVLVISREDFEERVVAGEAQGETAGRTRE